MRCLNVKVSDHAKNSWIFRYSATAADKWYEYHERRDNDEDIDSSPDLIHFQFVDVNFEIPIITHPHAQDENNYASYLHNKVKLRYELRMS